MKLSRKILLVLACSPLALGQFVQMGDKISGTGSLALSADGRTAVMGNDKVSALARVFTRVSGAWAQQGYVPGGPVALSADGNTAVVGSPGDGSGTGALWVYTRVDGVWNQQGGKLVGTGMSGNGGLGSSVALSADGNTAIAAGPGDGVHGAIWVFARTAGIWSQLGTKLVVTGTADIAGLSNRIGPVSISADGNTIAVGGPNDDALAPLGLPYKGAVWIFTRSNGAWTQQGDKLTATDSTGSIFWGSSVGSSVAISSDGNTVVAGGPGDAQYQGATWVFTRTNGVWTQQGGKLVGTNTLLTDVLQGTSVAVSGDGNVALIGGPGADYNKGAVWAFTRAGGVWTQQGERFVGAGVSGNFGAQGGTLALSTDGGTALVGGATDGYPFGIGATWTFLGLTSTNRITGNVTGSASGGVPGVTIGLTGAQTATATTDAAGHYDLGPVAPGGSYTVTPYLSGHVFNPTSVAITNLTGDQTANFTDVTPLQLVSPAPGSTLSGFSTTFVWNSMPGASAYWLDVGTAPAQGNIFGQNVGAATSQQVTGLPLNGGTVYVNLYANVSGVWQGKSYTYTAATGQDPKAVMTSPAAGSVLSGSTVTFNWTAGTGATAYWLDVGTSLRQGNIFGGNVGLVTSRQVAGLPTNGSTVYVSLYTNINGTWFENPYTYTASAGKASIVTPTPGSELEGSAMFTWTASSTATAYWLDVGTAPGQGNIFGANVGTELAQHVTGLPMNGSTIYVNLYSKINGNWLGNSYTYTACDGLAKIASPTPGSTLNGFTAMFTWTPGEGATAYWLDVGTAPGQGNIFGRNVGMATAQPVAGLPVNGSKVYVSLYSLAGGVWMGNSYVYTAYTGVDPKAVLTSPAPGSVLVGGQTTFTWSAGMGGVTGYWLDVGTAPGQGNIFGGNVGTATSKVVNWLPTDGKPIYVNLYSNIGGTWYGNSYTYTAAQDSRAGMISPVSGSTLPGFTATFSWSAGTGPTMFWLDVGTAPSQGNLFGGNVGTATSKTVSGLPMDGSAVYASLYSFVNNAWQVNSYTYKAATGTDPKATMIGPTPGSVLGGALATFTWTTGTGVSAYWLDVGTAPGQGNIFGGNVGTATSHVVSNLPTAGSTIYVNLYSNINGAWYGNAYTYAAVLDVRASVINPAPGSILSGFSATFTWTSGTGASAYWLDVGTAPSQGNIFGGNVGTQTAQTVVGLPMDGSTVYVSLYTNINGSWQGNSYTYKAATGQDPLAAIIRPAQGSVLTGGAATFTWSAGTRVTMYWLDVGTAPGQGNIFGGNVGTATFKAVTGIPTTGTVYVTLYSNIGGSWFGKSYTYAAAP